jgi:hypothetical protein
MPKFQRGKQLDDSVRAAMTSRHSRPEAATNHSLDPPSLGLFDLPGELRNLIYGYMGGEINAIRQTNKQLWTEFSTYVYHQKWFRLNLGEFRKDFLQGGIALLLPYRGMGASPRQFYKDIIQLPNWIKSPQQSSEAPRPFDPIAAREVRQLYVEDWCFESPPGVHPDHCEAYVLQSKDLHLFQIVFPRLQLLACCCRVFRVNYTKASRDSSPRQAALPPPIRDFSLELPPLGGPLALLYEWQQLWYISMKLGESGDYQGGREAYERAFSRLQHLKRQAHDVYRFETLVQKQLDLCCLLSPKHLEVGKLYAVWPAAVHVTKLIRSAPLETRIPYPYQPGFRQYAIVKRDEIYRWKFMGRIDPNKIANKGREKNVGSLQSEEAGMLTCAISKYVGTGSYQV